MCEKISYAAGLTSPILQLSPYHEIKLAGWILRKSALTVSKRSPFELCC